MDRLDSHNFESQIFSLEKFIQPNFGLPFIPGHEVVGKIALVQDSEKYSNLEIGQRVVIDNHFYCDKCDMCDEGACHMCPTFNHYGFGGGVDQGEVLN